MIDEIPVSQSPNIIETFRGRRVTETHAIPGADGKIPSYRKPNVTVDRSAPGIKEFEKRNGFQDKNIGQKVDELATWIDSQTTDKIPQRVKPQVASRYEDDSVPDTQPDLSSEIEDQQIEPPEFDPRSDSGFRDFLEYRATELTTSGVDASDIPVNDPNIPVSTLTEQLNARIARGTATEQPPPQRDPEGAESESQGVTTHTPLPDTLSETVAEPMATETVPTPRVLKDQEVDQTEASSPSTPSPEPPSLAPMSPTSSSTTVGVEPPLSVEPPSKPHESSPTSDAAGEASDGTKEVQQTIQAQFDQLVKEFEATTPGTPEETEAFNNLMDFESGVAANLLGVDVDEVRQELFNTQLFIFTANWLSNSSSLDQLQANLAGMYESWRVAQHLKGNMVTLDFESFLAEYKAALTQNVATDKQLKPETKQGAGAALIAESTVEDEIALARELLDLDTDVSAEPMETASSSSSVGPPRAQSSPSVQPAASTLQSSVSEAEVKPSQTEAKSSAVLEPESKPVFISTPTISEQLHDRDLLDIIKTEYASGQQPFSIEIPAADTSQALLGMFEGYLRRIPNADQQAPIELITTYESPTSIVVALKVPKVKSGEAVIGKIRIQDLGAGGIRSSVAEDFKGLPFGGNTFLKTKIGGLIPEAIKGINEQELEGQARLTGVHIQENMLIIEGAPISPRP